MTRRALARIGLALVLLVGALAVATLDPDQGPLPHRGSAVAPSPGSGRTAALTGDTPMGDPLAVASVRGADDERSASGRLLSVTLGAIVALFALLAWRSTRASGATDGVTHVMIRARRRAPPPLRSV